MAVAEEPTVRTQRALVTALAERGAEVRETHISWVLLLGDRAYKLKKALRLPFLDYGTLARRRLMCEEEIRLNRRMAPDLYLGVRSVLAGPDGLTFGRSEHPDALDHVVEMRRFDEHATLAARIRAGGVGDATLAEVGARIARFHASGPAVGAAGAAAALHRALAENADTLLALAPDREFRLRATALARFAEAFMSARREMLEARACAGLVCDGHGDLRAEHVVLEQGVEVVDCIEFDPALRIIDAGCDLGFLTMDLEALGAPEAARAVLAGYRAAGGDPGDDGLVAFFGAYRALVRAKVALVRAEQETDPVGARDTARSLLALAERLSWRARLPLMLVFAGLSATGKTRLATTLARRTGLPHFNSDVVRKQLVGVAARYSADSNRRTYERLGDLAWRELDRGGGALVDATFRQAADRAAFLGDRRLPASAVVVECRAPLATRIERARRRRTDPALVSDADAAVVRAQGDDPLPGDGIPPDQHIQLRGDRGVEEILDDLAALLDARLARGVGSP